MTGEPPIRLTRVTVPRVIPAAKEREGLVWGFLNAGGLFQDEGKLMQQVEGGAGGIHLGLGGGKKGGPKAAQKRVSR